MKSKIFTLILFLTTSAHAQDMLLQTRVEQGTLSALIDKTRILLNNSKVDDHLKGEVAFTDDISFSLGDISNDPDYLKFRDTFQSVFKIDLANASLRIRIPKLGYAIEELHVKPLSMNVQDLVLGLEITSLIRGLNINLTAGLDMDLMIINPKNNQLESYLTSHLLPTYITLPNTVEPISFNVNFETIRDHEFSFNVKDYNFDSIPDYVSRHKDDLLIQGNDQKPISANSITVNPVIVRVNDLSRNIQFDSFKHILQSKLNQIISAVIISLGKPLQKNIGPSLIKTVFSGKVSSDFKITNDSLYTGFLISQFSQPLNNQLKLDITGDLCTAETYKQYKELCGEKEEFPDPVRIISNEDHSKAAVEITDQLANGNSDMVLSLSEEYLNRLLHVTIQANLWDASLESQHLALGPKGAFIVFNQRTQSPELFLDVLYTGKGKGAEKILINKNRPIRFPLRISTSMDFVNINGSPHLVIKTNKMLSNADEIIHGIPEYDLQSHLIIGLRKTIAKMILKMTTEIEGKTAVDLDLPIFKNIDLEKTWHEASPFGRLNLFFKL